MSAGKVDVLAVMRHVLKCAIGRLTAHDESQARDAHAAVAELIHADREEIAARHAFFNAKGRDLDAAEARLDAADARRKAALARLM